MLVECPHPMMATCRERLKHDVVTLSRSDEAMLQSPKQLLFDQSEMWAVMMLCTSSVSFPVQPQMVAPLQRPWTPLVASAEEKAVAEGIRARATIHDRDCIIRAVAWLRPLSDTAVGQLARLSKKR